MRQGKSSAVLFVLSKIALLDWESHFSVSHFFVIKMNGDVSTFSEDRQKEVGQK